MGQNSSKRRSSKTKGKNGTSTISQKTNSDDPNGSIEVQQRRDTGGRENSPPTSPTSVTSASPSNASGKKEKKKRFRVSFSLNRTPSGRWSRKKKSSQNGTRPVSCPDPLRPEQAERPGRPHSLFLEDLEIPEEDNKVETVDLSDNEETNKKTADEDKSAPKPPERSKWKRGSHKKSSGKRKTKEKQTSKKEKKKKQTAGEEVTNVVAKQERITPAQMKVELPNKHDNETDVLKKEEFKDVPKLEKQQEEIDIPAIASSIVTHALEIAQNRLRSETCNDITSAGPQDHIAQQLSPEKSSCKSFNCSSNITVEPTNDTNQESYNDAKQGTGEEATTINSKVIESTTKVAEDIAEIIDKSMKTIPEPSIDLDFQTESQSNDVVDITENEDTLMTSTCTDNRAESQMETEKCEHIITHSSLEIKTENSRLVNSEIVDSDVNLESTNIKEGIELNLENDGSEEIAKKIVESVIAASVEIVIKDKYVDEIGDSNDLNRKCDKDESDLHNDNISPRLGQENEEKTQLETKKKDKDKSKKREKEKDRNNCKESAGAKSEKEKSKSETKMNVTKKLSHWFHKKDKPSKTISVIPVETPATDAAKDIAHAASSEHTSAPKQGQTVESPTDNIHPDSKESNPSELTSPTVDVSVTPSVMKASTDSSPDYSQTHNPSSTMTNNPTSPVSESDEVTPSPSAGDRSFGSSFLKKISIGPRLRTAILRKKSSASSDDQDKSKPSPAAQMTDESIVLTPPPRKLRQRKTEQECSPDTPINHNAASSPETSPQSSPADTGNSQTKPTPQSWSTKINVTTDDSGVADLTSPEEGNTTWSDESRENSANRVGAKAAIESVTCTNILTDISNETSQICHTDVRSDYEEDDTCPLSQRNSEETMYPDYDVNAKSMNYYSPLQSPTLVSTATIILRSVSSDEGVALAEDSSLNFETQTNTSKFPCDSNSKVEERCASAESIENASESPPKLDNNYKLDQSDKQTQNVVLSVGQETVKTDLVQPSLESDSSDHKHNLNDIAPPRGIHEKLSQKFSYPRTIAEFSIGVVADPADNTEAKIFQECSTDYLDNQQHFNSIKDGGGSASESTAPNSRIEAFAATDSSSIDPYLHAARQEDSSLVATENVFQAETNQLLPLQSSVNYEQTDFPSAANSKDGLNISQITRYSNGALDTDSSNNNGHHEDESICLKNNTIIALDSFKEKSDVHYQKVVGSIEESNAYYDGNERREPVDVNRVYITLLNGEFPNEVDS